jgi:hypothetical protein
LCGDEHLETTYNEITIKLNATLKRLKSTGKDDTTPTQDYAYYHLGIKYYKTIHTDQFFKRNPDKTYETKSYTDQVKALNNILLAFTLSQYFFNKVITGFPNSPWKDDARAKIILLKKLYKIYEGMKIQADTQIISTAEFVNIMGLKP